MAGVSWSPRPRLGVLLPRALAARSGVALEAHASDSRPQPQADRTIRAANPDTPVLRRGQTVGDSGLLNGSARQGRRPARARRLDGRHGRHLCLLSRPQPPQRLQPSPRAPRARPRRRGGWPLHRVTGGRTVTPRWTRTAVVAKGLCLAFARRIGSLEGG